MINQYDNNYFHFVLTKFPSAATVSLHKYLQIENIIWIKMKNTYGIAVYKKQKFVKYNDHKLYVCKNVVIIN